MRKNTIKSKRRIIFVYLYILLNITLVIVLVYATTGRVLGKMHVLIVFGVLFAINAILMLNNKFPKKFKTKDEPRMRFMAEHGSLAATLMCGCFAICVGSQIYQGVYVNSKMAEIDKIEKSVYDVASGYLTARAQVLYANPEYMHQSFYDQLWAIEEGLRVDSNYTYYADMTKDLNKYLNVLDSNAFNGNNVINTRENFNWHIRHIDSLFNKINEAKNNYYVIYDINEIEKKFEKKFEGKKKAFNYEEKNVQKSIEVLISILLGFISINAICLAQNRVTIQSQQ